MQQFPSPPGHKLPGYGFGLGPVFLSGQTEWYSGVQALIMISPSNGGPVTLRGRQLNGPGGIPFQGEQGEGAITIPTAVAGDWRWIGETISGSPGCYALQADGTSFTEVIVFTIKSGPAPPA